MAKKKIEINEKTSTGYEKLYPVTDASIINLNDYKKVEPVLDSTYGKVDSATILIGKVSAKADGMVIVLENVAITSSAWTSDTTYSDYPFVAVIPCAGIHKNYVSDVYFNMEDSTSGNFAPVSITTNNAVLIYAKEKPSKTITIPSVKCVVNVDGIEKDPVLLESIAISHMPTKTEYTEGDRLDLTGLEITATYDDGTSEVVTGWVSDPLPNTVLDTVGTQTVTISYTQVG